HGCYGWEVRERRAASAYRPAVALPTHIAAWTCVRAPPVASVFLPRACCRQPKMRADPEGAGRLKANPYAARTPFEVLGSDRHLAVCTLWPGRRLRCRPELGQHARGVIFFR